MQQVKRYINSCHKAERIVGGVGGRGGARVKEGKGQLFRLHGVS